MKINRTIILVAIIFMLTVTMASAYNGDICSETHSPCGGGCTSTDLSNMYNGYDWSVDANGYGDITGWDTSCITNINMLFKNSDFNQNIGSWNVSNVVGAAETFRNSSFNQNINSWDITSVCPNCFNAIFMDSDFNQPLNNWNMSGITSIDNMFLNTPFNQDISGWDVSHVTSMYNTFYGSSFNQNINSWNTSSVTDLTGTFSFSVFNQPLNNWDVSHVTTLFGTFLNSDFNQPLNNWDVSHVTTLYNTFYGSSFNQNINSWNTSSVTDMTQTFYEDIGFNQPLDNWDVSHVISMLSLFDSTVDFNQNISGWNISSLQDMSWMFYDTQFNYNINNWDISSVTNMEGAFCMNTNFNQPLNNWDVSSVTALYYMFYGATSFNQPLDNWDISSVGGYGLYKMFSGASSFNQDISMWNVSNIAYFNLAFSNTAINTTNYDAMLNSWSQQSVQSGVSFGADGLYYSPESADARASLISSYSWNIADAGLILYVDSVNISPSVVSPQNDVTGSCIITSATGSNITYTYKWFKNGVEFSSNNEELISGYELTASLDEVLNVGDVWIFSCSGNDGVYDTGFTNSSSMTVLVNQLPNLYPTITTPVYDVEDTLPAYCKATDSNGDNVTMDWILYRNSSIYSQGSLAEVAQNTNVLATTVTNESELVIGDVWIMSCRANDGYNITDYVNSSSATILRNARAPSLSYIHVHPLIIFNDTVISTTALATDVNGDILTYNYTLYVNNVSVETDNELKNQGAVSEGNFTYSSLSNNDSIIIGVVVSDIDFTNTEINSSEFIVRGTNSIPVVTVASTVPNVFVGADDNIKGYCHAIDSDGDTINYNYKWFKNGVVIDSGVKIYSSYYGYTQDTDVLVDTLSYTNTVEGDNITLSCQAYDVANSSLWVNSTEKLIYSTNNLPPTIESISLIPSGSHDTAQSFNVSVTGIDGDSDDILYEWRFVKNGQYQTISVTTYQTENVEYLLGVLNSSQTIAGDSWYVKVRSYDGSDYSAWSTSNTILITNTAPTILTSTIVSGEYENDTLVSSCSASDADDQDLTFSYKWFSNGVVVSTSENLASAYTHNGDSIILGCRANDGTADSNWLNSSSVTILDSANIPVISTVNIDGNSLGLNGTCLATDSDGDKLNYTYKWYKNSVIYSSGTELNVNQNSEISNYITPTITDGDVWIFNCAVSDALDGSAIEKNSSLTIPTVSFSYGVTDTSAQSITIDFSTNADEVQIFVDDDLEVITSEISYIIEDLLPNTVYEFKLVPVKDNFEVSSYIFNQSTDSTDDNPPTMTETTISPSIIYTESDISGSCIADDVESANLFFTYNWRVNGTIVSSGTTSFYDRNTVVSIGGLDSSNFAYTDNVSLGCQAHDGITSSSELISYIIVNNTEQVLSNALVTLNGTEFYCAYDYSDDDNDLETNDSYVWYRNDVLYSYNDTVIVTDVEVSDTLKCSANSSNAYHTVILNSSNYVVGDFDKPVLNIVSLPTQAFTDSSELIEVQCQDDSGIATGYPKISFLNPNLISEEYQLYYSEGINYLRYHTFSIAGEYTDIEIVCKDGNGNTAIEQVSEDILVQVRETVVNVGGSGGSSGEEEVFRNITSFTVEPTDFEFTLSPGSSIQGEYEVTNNDIVDIKFVNAVLFDERSPQTYGWIEFEDNRKATIFEIKAGSGLTSRDKFVRFVVDVPSNVDFGTYYGTIEVNGLETTESINIKINVEQSFFVNAFSFFQEPLFALPFTKEPTGAVTGTSDENVNFTVGALFITIMGIIILAVGYTQLKKRR